mgnify:CR=1 FL=1
MSTMIMVTEDHIPTVEVEVEEVKRPEPTTEISIIPDGGISESFPEANRWVIDEDGETYLLSSTEDLLSLALYEIDLTKGVTYGEENVLAYSSDVGADDFIVLQINVTTEGYPNQLLVAEEHNGALRMYLLSYNLDTNTAYLIPFIM